MVIECPKCGEETRTEVLAAAFLGGWCIGVTRSQKHRPVNYQVVGESEHS